jgi:predicted NBD/HSP70 family sugar kinase
MDGVRNAALVTISEGVGAAILANGQMVAGKSGLAGEFGHIPIDPSGPLCGCGRHGCWEVFASSRAALRYHAELAPDSHATTIQDLLNLAADNNENAIAALTKQAHYLGQGLRLITAALSPEAIFFTGDLTSSWERFGPIVESELNGQMLAGTAPRLRVTSDAELARLRGAAALVLQRHSGYHRSTQSHAVNGAAMRKRKDRQLVGAR